MTMTPPSFKCGSCSKLRENDSNHWFLLLKSLRDIPGQFMQIYPWQDVIDDGLARKENVEHACGQECAVTLTARWLDHKNFER